MWDAWRDGAFAEYAKVPLENCIPFDEARLCGGLGYSLQDLMYMAYLLVAYGGLRDIKLESDDTIIVFPATGFYSRLGVQVAIAMGARMIAMGRSEEDKDAAALQAFGAVDAVLDITPSDSSMSTRTKSAIKALRRGGRVSLMGSTQNLGVPEILINNITLKGKYAAVNQCTIIDTIKGNMML